MSWLKRVELAIETNKTCVSFIETTDIKRFLELLAYMLERYIDRIHLVILFHQARIYEAKLKRGTVKLEPFTTDSPLVVYPTLDEMLKKQGAFVYFFGLISPSNDEIKWILHWSQNDDLYKQERNQRGELVKTRSHVFVFVPKDILRPELHDYIDYVVAPLASGEEAKHLVNDILNNTAKIQRAKCSQDYGHECSDEEYVDYIRRKGLDLSMPKQLEHWAKGLSLSEVVTATLVSLKVYKRIRAEPFIEIKKEKFRALGLSYVDPTIGFEHIGGYDYLKDYIKHRILEPMRDPQRARRLNIKLPKGILLFGPPGTGKTLFAKALAKETSLPAVRLDFSDFMSKWIGESEGKLKKIFQLLRRIAPVLVILDEFDQLGMRRELISAGDAGVTRRLQNMWLSFMGEEHGCIFVATTNFIHQIDPAFLRPGRFDDIIPVLLPSKEALKEIYRVHLTVYNNFDDTDIDYEWLADNSLMFTGAEVEKAVSEAKIHAWLEGKDSIDMEDMVYGVKSIRINYRERLEMLRRILDTLRNLETTSSILLDKVEREVEEYTRIPLSNPM